MKIIAIVEDDDQAVSLFTSYIEQYERETNQQFNIVRFDNACDFIDNYNSIYAVVLMDIQMPKMNGGPRNKISIIDISICILPNGVIAVSIAAIQLILIALAPLFGMDAVNAWATYGIYCAIATGAGYVMTCLSAVLLLILEHRRIPKLGFWKTLVAILVWPLFLGLAIIQDIISLFVKNLEWKPIPHTGIEKK